MDAFGYANTIMLSLNFVIASMLLISLGLFFLTKDTQEGSLVVLDIRKMLSLSSFVLTRFNLLNVVITSFFAGFCYNRLEY